MLRLTVYLLTVSLFIFSCKKTDNQPVISEYLNYTVDGVTTSVAITPAGSDHWENQTIVHDIYGGRVAYIIGVENSSSGKKFQFSLIRPAGQISTGTLPVESIRHDSINFSGVPGFGYAAFTVFPGATGEFFEGTLTGYYTSNPTPGASIIHPVHASFRLKRNY